MIYSSPLDPPFPHSKTNPKKNKKKKDEFLDIEALDYREIKRVRKEKKTFGVLGIYRKEAVVVRFPI